MFYLNIQSIKKSFGNFFLEIENLEIEKGTFFGILGNSGSGKSTFLNLLSGLESADESKIYIDNNNISNLKPSKREISYLFQETLLFEHLNVKENIEYLLKAKGIKKELYKDIIDDVLKECEVYDLKYRNITTLSGGQKQRVAIASAIVHKPKLLLLDEPFSSLDIILRKKMRKFIKDLVKKHNITVIMVSHDILDAYELFDEMILLEKGKILQKGTPQNLYNSPKNKKVANFFGLENIFSGLVKNGIFYSKKLTIFVDFEDEEDICLLIPKNAIEVEEGNQLRIVDSIFIDGKSRVVLENGIIIFLENKPLDSLNINIDKTKVIKLGKN